MAAVPWAGPCMGPSVWCCQPQTRGDVMVPFVAWLWERLLPACGRPWCRRCCLLGQSWLPGTLLPGDLGWQHMRRLFHVQLRLVRRKAALRPTCTVSEPRTPRTGHVPRDSRRAGAPAPGPLGSPVRVLLATLPHWSSEQPVASPVHGDRSGDRSMQSLGCTRHGALGGLLAAKA